MGQLRHQPGLTLRNLLGDRLTPDEPGLHGAWPTSITTRQTLRQASYGSLTRRAQAAAARNADAAKTAQDQQADGQAPRESGSPCGHRPPGR